MRIHVVGVTASGKSTMARRLADRQGVPHVELDALYWEADWTPARPADFRDRVERALAGEAWVVDGSYLMIRDLIWSRADTVVWLDFSLPRILWQLLRRTLRRVARRETLWNGNRERLWTHLCTRDSLFLWVLTTFHRRQREYSRLLGSLENAHLRV
ncbi:MAG: adenylate kinase, partial [Candidatus Eremiobacterota bacterium]